MPESSPPGAPTGSLAASPRVRGEIVHEQTVRAAIPVAPASETTVRAPMPTPAPLEQTVRAFVPLAAAGAAAIEELDEVDLEPEADPSPSKPQGLDVSALVSELEAQARRRPAEADAPVSAADRVTVPEAAAKPPAEAPAGARPRRKRPRDEGPALRPEPPAVAGEVSVVEPAPGELFDSSVPRRGAPARAADRAPVPKVRRGDPPSVSGEVAIDPAKAKAPEVPAGDVRVAPLAVSGPQPVLTSAVPQGLMQASGSHPILLGAPSVPAMPSSGSHPILTISGSSPVVPCRPSTDSVFVSTEPTGPHPRMGMGLRRRDGSHDSLVLWALAGTLVVLAIGVVMMVISWTR
jgi:hypothetical protein